MQEIIIDEEFRFLLPTLDEETFRLLEESLLEHGCRDPLVLWNGILIDGYNRYKICSHHDIPFSTVNMEFDSREEVLIWIVTNQISRRNLTPTQLSHFRGLHYNAEKEMRGGDKFIQSRPKSQNDTLVSGSTATRLAEQYNVARATIIRDSKLSEGLTSVGKISSDVKRKILNGEVRVGKNRLESLASATPREVETFVREIEDGTFVSRIPRGDGVVSGSELIRADTGSGSALREIRQLNAIISKFASSFNSAISEMSDDNSAPLREVLRSYIDELEDLYSKLAQ